MNKIQKLLEMIVGLDGYDSKILIQPNTFYYIGASSSPDQIFVTKVDKNIIEYSKYPYFKTLKIKTFIGKDLITTGVNTHLKTINAMANHKYFSKIFNHKDTQDEIKKFKLLLDGKSVPPDAKSIKDVQVYKVHVFVKKLDPQDSYAVETKLKELGVSPSGGYDMINNKIAYDFSISKKELDDLKANKEFNIEFEIAQTKELE